MYPFERGIQQYDRAKLFQVVYFVETTATGDKRALDTLFDPVGCLLFALSEVLLTLLLKDLLDLLVLFGLYEIIRIDVVDSLLFGKGTCGRPFPHSHKSDQNNIFFHLFIFHSQSSIQ